MNKIFSTPILFYFSTIMLLGILSVCATAPKEYSEERVAQELRAIHERLGVTHDDLWNEISDSVGYTREQAIDLKRRVGELVTAYEELSVQASCQKHQFPSCADLFTAGLRFNISILDAEHEDLPPLPPVVEGYR